MWQNLSSEKLFCYKENNTMMGRQTQSFSQNKPPTCVNFLAKNGYGALLKPHSDAICGLPVLLYI